jgi:hypothetical protein
MTKLNAFRFALFSFALLAFLGSSHARASQEGAMALSSFSFQSTGVDWGTVSVSGTQNATGITALTIKAFRRDFVLTRAQLQELKGVIVNGFQLSGEGGYPELGGKTVYLQLSMGFTSGVHSGKRVIVNERGNLTIETMKIK